MSAPVYATPRTARTQANAFLAAMQAHPGVGYGSPWVALVGHTLRNPHANSDALLILADALRRYATEADHTTYTQHAMRSAADRLAHVARLRKDPLP